MNGVAIVQLIVGTLLTSFGTFWALEGLGVSWPQSDADIIACWSSAGPVNAWWLVPPLAVVMTAVSLWRWRLAVRQG